ncbi:serine threonine- kinase Nek5-like isoform X1 [Labeo rohita]|uniref:Serine threonine-kinase Nek5-like isoform X1 n=1 Tax=Labeo rohita TaxID=84645 RepID=A0A498MNB1_LABRO|nr:serine threonine- kinase Nek5-like isoform X1 [Labeo rohita]RXN18583.1 serine threonine- kinase Nek5-like isoform X1 [Labeo rohita]
MGSKQSVLQEKGYTVMSEQDNELMVKNNDGDQFVIKKLNANQNEASDFLQKLNHPHIVHHKEIIKDGDCLYLVMELCEGGDVSQKIKDKKKETEILDWTVKICMALKHLHDQQILHKNLQPKFAEKRTADIIPKILNGIYEALPTNFSEDLRQLVKDTLQIDPANRPSINEILMRPFIIKHLHEMSTKTVNKLNVCKKDEEETNESEDSQEAPIESEVSLKVLEELADGLERVHFNTTVGSLAGGVVGLAGGITSIVGLILTPFTLGASLIVTGVGIGVAVAGGVASGVSNITKMVNQRSDRQKVKLLITNIQEKITSTSYCIQNIQIAVETQRLLSESNESWLDAKSGENTLMRAGARLGRGLGGVAELVRLVQVTSAGRIAAQTARVVRVAEVATGVLTGLFVAVDIFFIALDSREIHNLRRDSASTNRNEQELRSEIMKFVKKIRETKDELKLILDELNGVLQSLKPQIPD